MEQLGVMERLRDAAIKDPYALDELRYLTYNIGPRLSGSPQAEQRSSAWRRRCAHWREVTLEKAKVRIGYAGGNGRGCVVDGAGAGTTQKVVLTALGGSVATPARESLPRCWW